MPVATDKRRHAALLMLTTVGNQELSCYITQSDADEEAATEDGTPRLDVTIADCGQL